MTPAAGVAESRDCIVMLTHTWNDRLAKHYARLKDSASAVHPVFLAFQVPEGGCAPADAPADFVIGVAQAARRFPRRHADYVAGGGASLMGYVDMIWLSVFLDERLSAFDRFWLVEYDVDYSGDWAGFFKEAGAYPGDILATHLRRRSNEPDWSYLGGVVDPQDNPADHLIGFCPLSRWSRAFVEHYRRAVGEPGWSGHFELLMPTIAVRGGFEVADIGGAGEFTPVARCNRHYEGDFTTLGRSFYTHGHRPVRRQHFFTESRLGYGQRNRIYHPVKVDITGDEAFFARWYAFRDAIRRELAHALGRQPTFRG